MQGNSEQPNGRVSLPLRELKVARTRLALASVAFERLRQRSLEEVPVKDLCEQAEICEATFFNYFARKDDLLHYMVHLWGVELSSRAAMSAGNVDSLAYVEHMFSSMGEQLRRSPRMILELVSHKAQCPYFNDSAPNDARALGEFALAFPDIPRQWLQPPQPLARIFRHALQGAVRRGELPEGSDIDTLDLALLNTFFGVPLWLGRTSPEAAPDAYRRQLDLLWAGARVGPG
jgi:AcrR family transcriptional regulator